jgi:tight adherence protein B
MSDVRAMDAWGSVAGAFPVPAQVLQVTATGVVLCLLGWAAWGLSSLDVESRRRSRLFPQDRAAPGDGDRCRSSRGESNPSECGRGERPPGSAGATCGRVRRIRRRIRRRLRTALSGSGPRGRLRPPPELLLLPLGLLVAWPTHSPLLAALAASAVLPAIRLRERRRRRLVREQRRLAVVGLCAALAGELRTGATPQQAAEVVGGELTAARTRPAAVGRPANGPVPLDGTVLLAAVRYGGSVPEAFRTMAELPGAEGAAGIAACWQVASSSGAGLAAGLDRVAEGLRAESALHETVRAELAGARSTAALLAALPLFGLLLGAGLGADPLRVLLHTTGGLACLALGALLECAGIAWTARIARGAELAVRSG